MASPSHECMVYSNATRIRRDLKISSRNLNKQYWMWIHFHVFGLLPKRSTSGHLLGMLDHLHAIGLSIDTWLYLRDMERLLCKVEDMQKDLSPLELGSESFMQKIDGCVKEMDICVCRYLVIYFVLKVYVESWLFISPPRHGVKQKTSFISIAN